MKRILIVSLVLCVSICAKAQTFKEWFEQKKTQIEYLVNQIAALQIYTFTIEKGYSIAHEGLSAIDNIKKGDFSLHNDYFTSLFTVNPQIKSYWKIGDIILSELNIVKACTKQRKLLNSSGLFSSGEIEYCSSVFTNLLNGCNEIIDQLTTITTDGQFQMTDDERLKRIDELYKDIKDREKFIQSFGGEVSLLAVQRVKDENDVKVSKSLLSIQ